jgi:ADP-ribose pyrophosphatase
MRHPDDRSETARLLDRRTLYEGSFLRLTAERVRLPGGSETELELLRHPGAAAMVPLVGEAEGEVLLVRQYRHATGGWLLEVPAGKLDAGESLTGCAHRELEEEVGHSATELVDLGWIWSSPGFTDERIQLYLARGLTATRQQLGDDEVLTVERLPLARAVAAAARGDIVDAKSVCALLRAGRYLERR